MKQGACRRGAGRSLWLLGLLALGACAAEPMCTLHKVAELPMAARAPLPVVHVRIDGRDATMLLDTGAQGLFLTPRGARDLGVQADPRLRGTATGIGGTVAALGVRLDRVSLGTSVLRGVPAGVLNQDLPSTGGVAVDGLFGVSVIDHYDLDLDMAARRASLYAGRACAASPPKWPGMQRLPARSLNGVFVIPVRLDGRPLEAMIDSGSQENVLFTDARGLAFARRHRLPGRVLRGVGPGLAHAFVARFATLDVGHETLHGVDMVATARRPGTPDLVLGQPFLTRYRVWFSAQRGVLIIAPPG